MTPVSQVGVRGAEVSSLRIQKVVSGSERKLECWVKPDAEDESEVVSSDGD